MSVILGRIDANWLTLDRQRHEIVLKMSKELHHALHWRLMQTIRSEQRIRLSYTNCREKGHIRYLLIHQRPQCIRPPERCLSLAGRRIRTGISVDLGNSNRQVPSEIVLDQLV